MSDESRDTIARPVRGAEFYERWRWSFDLVFVAPGDASSVFKDVNFWTDMLYRPGYTFSFLDGRGSPFPEADDYGRLTSFARTIGDPALLALYPEMSQLSGLVAPEDIAASLVSTSATWDAMREVTTAGSDVPALADPLTFGPGFSDLYIWSPRALWGIAHSSDGEVAIAGTWGPEVTGAFRKAFGIEGDGWTEGLEEGYGKGLSGAGQKGQPIVNLYRRTGERLRL